MNNSLNDGNLRVTQSTGTASPVRGTPSKFAIKIDIPVAFADVTVAMPVATSAEIKLYFRQLFNLPPQLADILWLLLQQQAANNSQTTLIMPPSVAEWLSLLGQGQAGYLLTLEGLQVFTYQQLNDALQKLSGMLQANQGVMQKGMGQEWQVLLELVQRQLTQTQLSPLHGLSTLLSLYLPQIDPFRVPDDLTCLWLPWQGQVLQLAGQPIVPISQGKGQGQQEKPPTHEQLVIYLTTAHLGRFRLALRLLPSPLGGSGSQHCGIFCQHEAQRFGKEESRLKLLVQFKEKLPKSLGSCFSLQWGVLASSEPNEGVLAPTANNAEDHWQRQRQAETTKAISPSQGVDALLLLYGQYLCETLLDLDQREGLQQQRQNKAL